MKRIVIESPLKANGLWSFKAHRLYALWCCRHMFECGYSPIASHIVFPSFMDDRVEAERQAGIDMPWAWQLDVPHYFFIDLGTSTGMSLGRQRCVELGIEVVDDGRLPPRHRAAFHAGELPPHTPGFEL